MKVWKQDAARFHASATSPSGEEREVFLWDFGGQDEYQLVHQLFLHDTSLALILIDPTRSSVEREKARELSVRLAKQLRGRAAVKLLIGAKVDDDTKAQLIDRTAIDQLCRECEFKGFFESSAESGRKVSELRTAIASAIDWSLGQTTRRELFQRIREEVDTRRRNGEVVVPLGEFFNDTIRTKYLDIFEEGAAAGVTDQLAEQGLLAKTQLKGGDEAIILRVDVIEQYAGSVVVLARDNPRGVPAIPEADLGTRQATLPGIDRLGRLPWLQERVVLECVIELMISHGICFRHQGLLVFPTLFKEAPTEAEAEKLRHTITLWYDFTGAIDNVYASLIAGLMVLRPFGPGRLTAGKAEFDDPKAGLCGLRRIRRPGGLAHIELFFGPDTAQTRQGEFTAHVEAHLREHGVEITEYRAIKCPGCGKEISEETVRERIADGKPDVVCPRCEKRTAIREGMTDGIAGVRERDPHTNAKVLALRQQIKKRLAADALAAKAVIAAVAGDPLPAQTQVARSGATVHSTKVLNTYESVSGSAESGVELSAKDSRAVARVVAVAASLPNEDGKPAGTVRILHLSDLHFTPDTAWKAELDALLNDLTHDDLNCDVVHHLVISGDFVDRGNPRAFPPCLEFVSAFRSELGISIERVVLVPGNHDVVDDDKFYQWRSKKNGLKEGEYVPEGRGFLARDPETWPARFKPFSDYMYHPLFQQPYPLNCSEQGQGFPPENTGVQFLAFNSAWEIDQTDRKRSGLHQEAVLNGIKAAEAHLKARPCPRPPLRVAVWHHAMMHVEGIKKVNVVGHLTKAKVRLVLHGDVHEANLASNPFQWPALAVLGAGTFGASTMDRPESTPRLYQVIDLVPGEGPGGFGWARVHTRARAKADGPWTGWYNWPDPDGGKRKVAYLDVDLNTGGPRKLRGR